MKIRLYCISDSDKHFKDAIDEYVKRLGSCVELITLKPYKNGTPEQIIAKETALIQEKISSEKAKGGYIILLSKEGKLLTTPQIQKLLYQSTPSALYIGGPYGLDEAQLKDVDMKLSLGAHTMPHGLAKLVLLEQIYRSSMLHAGKPYHY